MRFESLLLSVIQWNVLLCWQRPFWVDSKSSFENWPNCVRIFQRIKFPVNFPMFAQCLSKLFVPTMFLLYFLGICLALSTSRLAHVEQVSCLQFESEEEHNAHRLRPSATVRPNAIEEYAIRLEIIKHKILKKLGLKEAPRVDQRLSNKIASKFSNWKFSKFEFQTKKFVECGDF